MFKKTYRRRRDNEKFEFLKMFFKYFTLTFFLIFSIIIIAEILKYNLWNIILKTMHKYSLK